MKQCMRDYHDILLLMFKITHGFILVCNESFFPFFFNQWQANGAALLYFSNIIFTIIFHFLDVAPSLLFFALLYSFCIGVIGSFRAAEIFS